MTNQPEVPELSPAEPEYELFRLPEHVAAGLILAFIVLLLGAGLFANRYLRPPTGMVSTPIPTETPVAALATGTSAPVAMGAVALPTSAVSRPTATAPPAPTATPPWFLTSTPKPVASPTPSPGPTVDPVVAAEIQSAYAAYWDIRAQALQELDTSHLREVAAGKGLSVLERGVQRLKSEQRALHTRVEHSYRVVQVTDTTAEVADAYVDDSYFVDPTTYEPLEPQPTGDPATRTVRELYELQRIDGTWKVVDGFRVP